MTAKLVIIFDTETTGLPKNMGKSAWLEKNNWPDLVSIAWSKWRGDTREAHKSYIIKPAGWIIPAESIAIHGITQEIAETRGCDLLKVLCEFLGDMKECDHVIAHNLHFDKNIIINCVKWRVKLPRAMGRWQWPKDAEYCSMRSNAAIIADGVKRGAYIKLDVMYTAVTGKEPPVDAHDASRDVLVLEEILRARMRDTLFWRRDEKAPNIETTDAFKAAIVPITRPLGIIAHPRPIAPINETTLSAAFATISAPWISLFTSVDISTCLRSIFTQINEFTYPIWPAPEDLFKPFAARSELPDELIICREVSGADRRAMADGKTVMTIDAALTGDKHPHYELWAPFMELLDHAIIFASVTRRQ